MEDNIEKSINERRNPPPSSNNEFYTKLNSAFASFDANYRKVEGNLDYIEKLTAQQKTDLRNWAIRNQESVTRVVNYLN